MQFEITKWELSDIKNFERARFDEGLCTVKITDADYSPDDFTYNVSIESIEDGPSLGTKANLRYYLFNRKSGQEPKLNKNVAGTLVSLGKALYGEPVGIPAPVDVIGKVVTAQIKPKEVNGQIYIRVYQFEPAGKDFEFLSDKPQYFRAPTPGVSR